MNEVKHHGIFKNAAYVMKELFRNYPKNKWMVPLKVLFDIAMPLITTFVLAYTVNLIVGGVDMIHFVAFLSLFFALLCIANSLKKHVDDWVGESNSWLRFINFGQILINKAITTDYCNIEPQDKQRKMQRASGALNSGDSIQRMAGVVPGFLVSFIGLIINSFAIVVLDFRILLVLVFVSASTVFLNRHATHRHQKLRDEDAAISRKGSYLHDISVALENGKDIKTYNMKSWLIGAMNMVSTDRLVYQKKVERIWDLPRFANILFTLIREFVVYFVLVYQVVNNHISIPIFTVYIGLVSVFSGWANSLVDNFSALQRCTLYVDDYRHIVEMPDFFASRDSKDVILGNYFDIEFDNVSFKYNEDDEYILKDLSFKINHGEKIALVGNNGAGKTTIVKLLCGFYRPTSGNIYVGGKKVEDYNAADYYRIIGAVFQDVRPLAFTIAQNVSGKYLDETNMERVRQCLSLSGLSDKVNELEQKELTYYTNRLDKKGTELSGGEIQKLMLARVLYKDAPIIILDEPTASMDSISESRMYENYNEFTRNKTSIFITHRIASTRFCDKIYFLEKGELIEVGSHEELLKIPDGKYANMFKLQSHYYFEDVKVGDEI